MSTIVSVQFSRKHIKTGTTTGRRLQADTHSAAAAAVVTPASPPQL